MIETSLMVNDYPEPHEIIDCDDDDDDDDYDLYYADEYHELEMLEVM